MESLDALYNLSEVAITLAGFIAVATALRARSETAASATKVRVVNLLLSSFVILLLSQAAIALIHAGVPKHLVWQMSSTFWIAITVLASAYNLKNQTVLVEAGMELPRHLNLIQWSALLLVLVLQIVNILLLKAFWPFLIAIILILVIAGVSFTIIVLQFLKEPSRSADPTTKE